MTVTTFTRGEGGHDCLEEKWRRVVGGSTMMACSDGSKQEPKGVDGEGDVVVGREGKRVTLL